jgi:hypothetical protein
MILRLIDLHLIVELKIGLLHLSALLLVHSLDFVKLLQNPIVLLDTNFLLGHLERGGA